jgi:dimethylhistidine N-methyltransferase
MQTIMARPGKSVYQFRNLLIDRQQDSLEIEAGLRAKKKTIAAKYFYDALGQRLFDEISATEDYYLTRAETEILAQNAGEIADIIGNNCVLIEPGCGNCLKVEYLFKQFRPDLYVMLDIEENVLKSAASRLNHRYPDLSCTAVAADFSDISLLQQQLPPLRRVVFYPGSTIGNFEPDGAINFLQTIRAFTGSEGGLLIGVDLEKDAAILDRAYNDREGATAAFNLNILNNVNRIVGSNFSLDDFYHRAFYDSRKHRIEMHLCSERRHTVMVAGEPISFAAGESIHTENSYKYSIASFSAIAAEAGFMRMRTWFDSKRLFALHYFIAYDQRSRGMRRRVLSMQSTRRH